MKEKIALVILIWHGLMSEVVEKASWNDLTKMVQNSYRVHPGG
jgi:hypothetical protein